MDRKELTTAALDESAESLLKMPAPGDRIGEKYMITRRIGEGGMGVVFEALHLRLRQPVALKFLHPSALAFPDSVTRFEREARATGQLRGLHVTHVLDVDVDAQGLPYIVMELLPGRDLDAEMQLRPGPFPVGEAVDYVIQACAGMAEAHALGIVHRDLKPSNLFLCEKDGDDAPSAPRGPHPHSQNRRGARAGDLPRTVKVLDFGISKMMTPKLTSVTSTCVSIGTPLYMSPEQVRSSKYVDGRTDIWSLGVILFELLTGEPPFNGTATAVIAAIVADPTPSLRALRPDLPPALEDILFKALAKDADERYADVYVLAEALAPFALSPLPNLTRNVSRPSYSEVPESGPLMHARPVTPAKPSRTEAAPARRRDLGKTGPRFHPRPRLAALAAALLALPLVAFATMSFGPSRAHATSGGVESPHGMLDETASSSPRRAAEYAPPPAPQGVEDPLSTPSGATADKAAPTANANVVTRSAPAGKRPAKGNPLYL